MKKLLVFLLLLLIAAGAGAAVLYSRVNQPYRGYDGAEQFVEIAPGNGSLGIGERLVASGVIRDMLTYRTALWMSRHNIKVPIYGLTSQPVSQRRMALMRNVRPLLMRQFDDRFGVRIAGALEEKSGGVERHVELA